MTAASIICRSDATRDGTHRSLPSQRADVSYVRVSRWQELTLLAVLFVSVYLVGGEYSRAVCTIFTTAPAAVYTCVQLASTRDHTSCYKATLSYWAVHSALFVFDNFLVAAFGYYLGKFLVLTTLLLHVVRSNRATRRKTEQISSSLCSNTAIRTSTHLMSRNGTRTMSHWGTEPYRSSALSLRTFVEAPTDQTLPLSAQKVTATTFKEYSDASQIDASRSDPQLYSHSPLSEKASVYVYALLNDGSHEDCWVPANCSTATMAISEETVAVFEGDVTSVPSEEVLFKEPYREIVDLAISNRRKRSMMWALKSSAPSRLMARPTCGVLAPRSTVNIKLGVLEPDAVNAETREDILAFDYSFVNEPNIAFDRSFLVRSDPNKRRKKLRICYNDRSSRNRL